MRSFRGRRLWGVAATVVATLIALSDVRGADQPSARSPEDIRAIVEEMRKPDVAWREVRWQTCLLDGLRESRLTGKPVLLWIFIDRTIDDERC